MESGQDFYYIRNTDLKFPLNMNYSSATAAVAHIFLAFQYIGDHQKLHKA